MLPVDRSQEIPKGRRPHHSSWLSSGFQCPKNLRVLPAFQLQRQQKSTSRQALLSLHIPPHKFRAVAESPDHRGASWSASALAPKTQESQQPRGHFALWDGFCQRTLSSLFCYTTPGFDPGELHLLPQEQFCSWLGRRQYFCAGCFATKAVKLRDSYLLGSKSQTIIFCDHECFIGNTSCRIEELRSWPHPDVHQGLGFSYVTSARELNGITHTSKIGHVLFTRPTPSNQILPLKLKMPSLGLGSSNIRLLLPSWSSEMKVLRTGISLPVQQTHPPPKVTDVKSDLFFFL